jgi:hypothetical protein
MANLFMVRTFRERGFPEIDVLGVRLSVEAVANLAVWMRLAVEMEEGGPELYRREWEAANE